MSEVSPDISQKNSDMQQTFANENSWMVQCLSLAALGMMTYLHLAPLISGDVT